MKALTFLPKTVSVSDLQRNYSEVLQTANTSKQPVYLLNRDTVMGVLLSKAKFEWLVKKIERLWEEKDTWEAIAIGERERATGKLKKLTSLTDLLK